MFKYFKNIKNVNKVWKMLNDKYFNELSGKIGNTVLKIDEDTMNGSYLLVKTDNENVKSILIKNESGILNDIFREVGIQLIKIKIL